MERTLEDITYDLAKNSYWSIPSPADCKDLAIRAAYAVFEEVCCYNFSLSSRLPFHYNWDELETYYESYDCAKYYDKMVIFEGCDLIKFAEDATKTILEKLRGAMKEHANKYPEYNGLDFLSEFESVGGPERFKNTLAAMLYKFDTLYKLEENGKKYTIINNFYHLEPLKLIFKNN